MRDRRRRRRLGGRRRGRRSGEGRQEDGRREGGLRGSLRGRGRLLFGGRDAPGLAVFFEWLFEWLFVLIGRTRASGGGEHVRHLRNGRGGGLFRRGRLERRLPAALETAKQVHEGELRDELERLDHARTLGGDGFDIRIRMEAERVL